MFQGEMLVTPPCPDPDVAKPLAGLNLWEIMGMLVTPPCPDPDVAKSPADLNP